jgi:hypothetical protein
MLVQIHEQGEPIDLQPLGVSADNRRRLAVLQNLREEDRVVKELLRLQFLLQSWVEVGLGPGDLGFGLVARNV